MLTKALLSGAALALLSCKPAPESRAPQTTAAPAVTWLCRPDRPGDPCRTADLTTTEIREDGTRVVVPFRLAERPKVDCFYVYPTVDLDLIPGNHMDLTDDAKPRATTLAQGARFGEACAVWAPLYRQVTIGTYLQAPDEQEKRLAFAFADVERAFREYLATSDPSRPIVIVGHSQGAEMVNRLLRRFFDEDPALRARLLLALPIGGDVDVARGTSFGTSRTVPPCTAPLQRGCLVAFRTYSANEEVEPSRWAPPPGHVTVGVDPSTLDGPTPRLAGAIFPTTRALGRLRDEARVTTPFVAYPAFYAARCVSGKDGFAYLAITQPPTDPRRGPLDLDDRRFRFAKLGLHVLDMQLPQRDLVDLVVRRAAAL